jgi:hypothetical protein
MIDHQQIGDLWQFLTVCGVGGVWWLIANGIAAIVRNRKRAVRFVMMTFFACIWILFLWPTMGRAHRETWPYVFSILAWWMGVVVGNMIEMRREDKAEQGGGHVR